MRLTAALRGEAGRGDRDHEDDDEEDLDGDARDEDARGQACWQDMVVTEDEMSELAQSLVFPQEAESLAKQLTILQSTRPKLVPCLKLLHQECDQAEGATAMDSLRTVAKNGLISLLKTPLGATMPIIKLRVSLPKSNSRASR